MVKGALSTAMVTGALAGAASGAILTRSFSGAMKGALFGPLSAGAANMIGHGTGVFAKVRSYGSVAKATLHGLSRMAIAKLQYGTAKGSFLSGLAGSILGGYVAKNFSQAHIAVKTTIAAIAAIAGGTASAIGGGKFANGAMGGAFIMLFNDLVRGAYTRTFKDRATLSASMKDGDVIYGKRTLSALKYTKWIQQSQADDRLNSEINHEHIFYKEGNNLYDIGYSSTGTFNGENPADYIFSNTTYNTNNFNLFINNPSGYTPNDYHLFKHNCQDYADYIHGKL
ncbi:MAG: Unknown protein [uncultured Sulfurovum sp.]|uniref:Uncharacterized protein n=1 Tax=uncultured Sulfurovum sp. TaxID=269237 RepID=A0A6S6TS32_9BACT|nr:MAG: Unknown protein [uncultured Sulfurovum sp.]